MPYRCGRDTLNKLSDRTVGFRLFSLLLFRLRLSFSAVLYREKLLKANISGRTEFGINMKEKENKKKLEGSSVRRLRDIL